MLWSQPGTVTDDTKTYLYLDPGRYVRQAMSLWNPNVALGTVTHENIGYLLPMGPFYWADGRAARVHCGWRNACGSGPCSSPPGPGCCISAGRSA